MLQPFIALTELEWFEFLQSRAEGGSLDEVNFWSPKSPRPMKRLRPGEPVFLRLKRPHFKIAGYGFFAAFTTMGIEEAWETFGEKNGDPSLTFFLTRIGAYRKVDLFDPEVARQVLGCTIFRDAVFWPEDRWIPWGEAEGWKPETERGKSEEDPARASRLLQEIAFDSMREPEEFAGEFIPLAVDDREIVLAREKRRVGQGAFRSRLLDAYGRRCAVTGERTEPVLDAAHIQPYLGPRSNHVRNGLLLCKEFHTLFDLGYVTVTPALEVRVSPRLRGEWQNGRRYYACDGKTLASVPRSPDLTPSPAALEWHGRRRFRA